jgi:4-aminobutyrate aminotransferase
VIVETVRSTDVQVPPRAYYETLRAACDRHGALLILDEIPVCLGRTGAMFAFERYGSFPTWSCIGKGLGGGIFPMAALLARAGSTSPPTGRSATTRTRKSSVGCAAALATIEVIESKHLLERANRLGMQALERLREMKARFPAIIDVRGIGLLLAIEFKDPEIAEDVMYRSLANGLSFKVGQGNVIVLAPPLVIEERDLENALFIVEDAIAKSLDG